MVYGPVAQDLAVTIASLIHWSSDPVFAASCLARGYQRFMPLEAEDLALLRDLVLARLMLQVGIVAYRAKANDATPLDDLQVLYMTAIERIVAVNATDFVGGMLPSVVPVSGIAPETRTVATPSLLKQREAVLGKTYTFYNEPWNSFEVGDPTCGTRRATNTSTVTITSPISVIAIPMSWMPWQGRRAR
jgi:hypothetical protein